MKKMILSAFALTVFGTASFAQTATQTAPPANDPATGQTVAQATPAAVAQDNNKKQVDAAALPDGIKKTLASDQYKDWQLASAWLVSGPAEYYILEMQKGEEKTTLKLDKDGKQVG